jgi:heptosyltransferase-2
MQTGCRHFNGYKPCGKNTRCSDSCPSFAPIDERILLIHLEALGAVLRSTSLLAAIKRRYPRSHITWITKAPAHILLENLTAVDRVLTLNAEDLLKLSALEFDLALVIDKSLVATGLLRQTQVREVRGFDSLPGGAIMPANPEARELWEIGLSDQKKFFENQKSEQRLVHESLALGPYRRDGYAVALSTGEREAMLGRRRLWARGSAPILGINTGCSPTLPHKKLSVSGHRSLIEYIRRQPELAECPIVLLGGPEDRERNSAIAHGLSVIQSPTHRGLRDGLVSVAACDLVFSGDSLGMHMAIALEKWVVAWFGPSCAQEIDLYDRGRKILTRAPCSPCWKRVCQQSRMCYDQIDFQQAIDALKEGMQWLTSSSKRPSPGTSFSPSPY